MDEDVHICLGQNTNRGIMEAADAIRHPSTWQYLTWLSLVRCAFGWRSVYMLTLNYLLPMRIKCKQRTNRTFIINSTSANFIEHPYKPHSQRHSTVRYLSTSVGHARQPHVAVRKPSLLSCHYILNKAWTLIQKYNTIMTKISLLESNGRYKNRTRPDWRSK